MIEKGKKRYYFDNIEFKGNITFQRRSEKQIILSPSSDKSYSGLLIV